MHTIINTEGIHQREILGFGIGYQFTVSAFLIARDRKYQQFGPNGDS